MAADRVKPDHAAQVQACLDTVMDPELDESVVELGFLTAVDITGAGEVQIAFRLPTYWCAPNFAFLMADDMRRAVKTLPWVSGVQVRLQEHMYAETINDGVAAGAGFQAAFGDAAAGDLSALRRTFLVKAFQRRQEALLQHLVDAGQTHAALVALDTAGLQALTLDADGDRLRQRYLQRRDLVGGTGLAFVDTDGAAIASPALALHLRELRRVSVNAEFNGVLCRGLLAVRDNEMTEQPIHIVRRSPAATGAKITS